MGNRWKIKIFFIFFNFVETQELLIWLIFAPKRPDLEVFAQMFLLNDRQGIYFSGCVCVHFIKVFNNREKSFYSNFRATFSSKR